MNDAVRGETVADYKRLLQTVCDNRPSGTRGRLAVALGTNRSFVSQLVNPAYAMPIPAQPPTPDSTAMYCLPACS